MHEEVAGRPQEGFPGLALYKLEIQRDKHIGPRLQAIPTLLSLGCCCRCVLRFLNERTFALYRQSDEYIMALLEQLVDPLPEEKKQLTEWRSVTSTEGKEGAVCVACLGCLQNICSERFTSDILEAFPGCGYEFDNYSLTITVPCATIIRQFSLWYHLQSVFGPKGIFKAAQPKDEMVEIKEAIKWVLGYLLQHKLNLRFEHASLFNARITFKHEETEKEHEFLCQIEETNLRNRKVRKRRPKREPQAVNFLAIGVEEASITAIQKALTGLPKATFIKYGSCPPKAVSLAASYSLSFFHQSIFVAGRYMKYSRDLPQSPWILDGKRMTESSVSELLTQQLLPYFAADSCRFSASGREDVDVRMLGDGRPFVVELVNPHRSLFSRQHYSEMQDLINRSTKLLQVQDVQRINKEDSARIGEGEDERGDKRKTYRCVVWVDRPITPEDLVPISAMKDIRLDQKTPVRVLHRRSLATRVKMIYALECKFVSSHFIVVDIVSQAGTYIKEFIHGDLGRTRPGFGELINAQTDILQLDVLKIGLDFPPRLEGPPAETPAKGEPGNE